MMDAVERPLLRTNSEMGRPGATALFLYGLLLSVVPMMVSAHTSIKEIEGQLQARERSLELTNHAAPAFALESSNGSEFKLADILGKVVILNFVYAQCQEACASQIAKLAEVQELLQEAALSDRVQFVSIAQGTDDAVTVAEVVKSHGQTYGLDPSGWIIVYARSGDGKPGIGIAEEYGLTFVLSPDGERAYEAVAHLIDQQGVLRARYRGLDFSATSLMLHAAALLHDDHNTVAEGEPEIVGRSSRNDTSAAARSRGTSWWQVLIGVLSLIMLLWVARSFYRERMSDGNELNAGGSVSYSRDGEDAS